MPGHYGFREQWNSVQMIRHNNEGIQDDIRKMNRYGIPRRNHDVPCLAGYYRAVDDVTEDALSVSRANSDEIRPGLGIIESRQAQRLPPSRWLQMIRSRPRAVFLNNLGHDES